MRIAFEVREDTMGPVREIVNRTVKQHKDWQEVVYNGRRYQLFYGIRAVRYINLSRPINHCHTWKTDPNSGGLIDVCSECGEERA